MAFKKFQSTEKLTPLSKEEAEKLKLAAQKKLGK